MEHEIPSASSPDEGIRINKYLASCGYESRRKADQLIADGVVEINGKRVEAPGARVKPGDFVKVNGHRALPKEEVTLLLNKPRGFVCSRDPQGAEGTVYDLLPPKYRYVNYVGRLDTDSEGLLILTNKGEISKHLGHPSGGVEKEYWVTLDQQYENSVLLQLLKGVRIPEGQAKAKYISRLSPRRACVVLEQGLKRQVRQMFACLGYRVRKLVRVRIGSLWGGDLMPGRAMLLTPEQEKLAGVNPPQRKGLISAAQAFPSGGSLSAEQIARVMDEKEARAALEAETDYKFNPADFETDEDVAAEGAFRAWDDEDFRPAPRRDRNFRAPREGGARRQDARGERRFGSRRPEGERSFGGGRRRSFGDAPHTRERRSDRFSGESRGFDRPRSSRRDFTQDGGADKPRRRYRDFSDRAESFDSPRSFRRERSGEDHSRSHFRKPQGRSFGDRQGGAGSRSGGFRKPNSRSFGNKRGGRRF